MGGGGISWARYMKMADRRDLLAGESDATMARPFVSSLAPTRVSHCLAEDLSLAVSPGPGDNQRDQYLGENSAIMRPGVRLHRSFHHHLQPPTTPCS